MVCKTLLDPGDVVVAEAPTYPGAIPTFHSYQADVVQVRMDRDGMRVDELEQTLDDLERTGRRPKFIYTVPNFHNPAGVTMSLERRRQLVRIAGERELIVLEDNPYGLLRYEGESLPPLHALDDEFVIYASTFSKILSPGVRLGWAAAPAPAECAGSRRISIQSSRPAGRAAPPARWRPRRRSDSRARSGARAAAPG